MLQWLEPNGWEHRAFWGADQINFGISGQSSRYYMGALPPAGQWVRLEVPAASVGLQGYTISGMSFALFGGQATWSEAGKNIYGVLPDQPPSTDTVWVEDGLPTGATSATYGGDTWSWVSANPLPFAGASAHQSNLVPNNPHQHYFTSATSTLTVNAGEKLVTYVYLDPVNPPSEVMLQWYDPATPGAEWEHRAFWGADQIGWGVSGQSSRYYMGALPATGQWVRLEVPVNLVGLQGHALTGMSFTLFGGRATWDHSGKGL